MDQLASRAEQESTEKNHRPIDDFRTWELGLNTPPAVWLGDHDAVEGVVWASFLDRFAAAVEDYQADRSTHALDEGVPAEWANDRLLSEMAESYRSGE